MRRVAILSLLMLVLGASARAQDIFRAPEGDFAVAFPMAPTVQSKPARRSKDVAQRRYVDDENGRVFSVGIDEYPDGVLPPSPTESTYDRVLNMLAGDDPQSLKSTRPARLSGKPCLKGHFEDMDGDVRIVRVLIIGDRVYQVSYIHAENVDPPGESDAFFNSFRITTP
jgi:hypothetical protein